MAKNGGFRPGQWWEHFHPTNGFTYAGAAIYNSMIPGRADAARDQLVDFVYTDRKGGANTMYTEGSQCNESPLMTAFALQQMLLQSFNGELHVFPALPSSWPNATFFNMRTEGAFLVSASARSGSTRAVRIESLAGSSCVLRTRFGAAVQSEPAGAATALAGGRLSVALGANASVLLWLAGEPMPGADEFAPLPIAAENRSHWGVPGHGRLPPAPPPPGPAVPCTAADGYRCYSGRCADNTGKVRKNCGTDLCWPTVTNASLCRPLPEGSSKLATAAARCNGVPECHAFGLCLSYMGGKSAKFFTVHDESQLIPAQGWKMWMKPNVVRS
jgi:hypothetical protein